MIPNSRLGCATVLISLGRAAAAWSQPPDAPTALHFEDITEQVGLGRDVIGTRVARCIFVDLNGDGRADVVLQSQVPPAGVEKDAAPAGMHWPRAFLHTADSSRPLGFRYDFF